MLFPVFGADECGCDGAEWNFFAGLVCPQEADPNASKQMTTTAVFIAASSLLFCHSSRSD